MLANLPILLPADLRRLLLLLPVRASAVHLALVLRIASVGTSSFCLLCSQGSEAPQFDSANDSERHWCAAPSACRA